MLNAITNIKSSGPPITRAVKRLDMVEACKDTRAVDVIVRYMSLCDCSTCAVATLVR